MLLAITLIVFSGYLYLQLDDSLLAQVDTALQLTASQFSDEFIYETDIPFFRENPDMASRFSQAGIALRLIDNQGKVWDGFGNYENLPLLISKKAGYLNLKGNETIWRVYSFPLRENYWLEVAESLKPVYEASSHLLVLMLWGFPLVLIFTALVGFWLAQVALSPLERMIRTAEAINDNDLSQRIGYRGVEDEVGRLASTIDRMLDRLEAAFQHERRFTADAAHELRTPLTINY
jgi:methyl-accepting chemotaxis protein